MGDQVIVAELESFKPVPDDNLRRSILQQEFEIWLTAECEKMLSKTSFTI